MVRMLKKSDTKRILEICEGSAKKLLHNINDIISQNSGRFLVYEESGLVVGFGFVQPFSNGIRCDVCVVVSESFRRRGYGRILYNSLISSIIKAKLQSFECTLMYDDPPSLSFAQNMGFSRVSDIYDMTYCDEFLPTQQLSFVPYEDKFYDTYYALLGASFFSLRKSLDIQPHILTPDGDREAMFEGGQTYLSLNSDMELVAAVSIHDNLIDNLAVLPKYQGLGYGRQLAIFATNKALLSPLGFAWLSVLSDNTAAVELYRSLGYSISGTKTLMRKHI